jgi:hypothetical protein
MAEGAPFEVDAYVLAQEKDRVFFELDRSATTEWMDLTCPLSAIPLSAIRTNGRIGLRSYMESVRRTIA